MCNVNKVINLMLILIISILWCVSCSSSIKPPEEEIQGIIMAIELKNNIDKNDISNINFDVFQITNGFFSKQKGGGGESTPYNIEVNYKISYMLTTNMVKYKNDLINKANETKRDAERLGGEYNVNLAKNMTTEIERIKLLSDIKKEKGEIGKNNARLSFVKKGDKWYGGEGWR